MSLFLRLLEEDDKGAALLEVVRAGAAGEADGRVFEVDPKSFGQVPGALVPTLCVGMQSWPLRRPVPRDAGASVLAPTLERGSQMAQMGSLR